MIFGFFQWLVSLTIESVDKFDQIFISSDGLVFRFISKYLQWGTALRSKIYDTCEDFNYPIVNFPFLSSNIPISFKPTCIMDCCFFNICIITLFGCPFGLSYLAIASCLFFPNNTSVDTEMCCPKGKCGCQYFILLTLKKKNSWNTGVLNFF